MVISFCKRGNAMTARRPKPVHQLTLAQFDAMFPAGDDEACKAYLVARRWPDGVKCPRCGNRDLYDASSYKSFHWQCRACAVDGYRFSCIAGTIFENTNKPLRDWFKITHLILTSKKGMSARQLGRYMGFGSVKTAWLMGHKIRVALIEPEEKLGGIVEVDETFVGGRAKNRHADKRDGIPGPTGSGKAIIAGAVLRHECRRYRRFRYENGIQKDRWPLLHGLCSVSRRLRQKADYSVLLAIRLRHEQLLSRKKQTAQLYKIEPRRPVLPNVGRANYLCQVRVHRPRKDGRKHDHT
jgi:Transposase zinc-ribbon domain